MPKPNRATEPIILDHDLTAMLALAPVYNALRDLAARRRITPTDRLHISLRRNGIDHCLQSWNVFLGDFTELWPEEFPEVDREGVPTNLLNRRILVALLAGPLKVARLAEQLGLDNTKLYGEHGLKELEAMELIEKNPAGLGKRLTAKGKRVALAIRDEQESEGERDE